MSGKQKKICGGVSFNSFLVVANSNPANEENLHKIVSKQQNFVFAPFLGFETEITKEII